VSETSALLVTLYANNGASKLAVQRGVKTQVA